MTLVELGGTLQLKDSFNARTDDAARILMVVSPTCPDCLRGVSVVSEAARELEATNFTLLVLWTAMRPGDSEAAALGASAAFDSAAGFSHYWEEDGWPISTALRPLLAWGNMSRPEAHGMCTCSTGLASPGSVRSLRLRPHGRTISSPSRASATASPSPPSPAGSMAAHN